jgi:hypothetical protein
MRSQIEKWNRLNLEPTLHYFDWELANCHFFALDTRGERGSFDKNRPDDPNTSLLGEAQRRWLIEGITSSRAEFIFIISSDPWVIYHTSFRMLLHNEPKLIDNPPRPIMSHILGTATRTT